VCARVYAHLYACVCTRAYACVYLLVCMLTCVLVCVLVCMLMCIVYACVHACICLFVCLHANQTEPKVCASKIRLLDVNIEHESVVPQGHLTHFWLLRALTCTPHAPCPCERKKGAWLCLTWMRRTQSCCQGL